MSRIATKATEVFTFAELSPKAQTKAIESQSESNGIFWDSGYVTNEFKKKLEALGFEGVDTHYSGFYSQGDGASFTATSFDIRKVMKAAKIAGLYKSFYAIVKTQDVQGRVYSMNSHYCHENSVGVDFPDYYGFNKQESDVIDALRTYVRKLCKDYYVSLEADYEYATSEENAKKIKKVQSMIFHDIF